MPPPDQPVPLSDDRCTPIEVYLTERDTDLERMYVALAEVGLMPDENGGGWLGWDRHLTQAEYDLVVKAESLVR